MATRAEPFVTSTDDSPSGRIVTRRTSSRARTRTVRPRISRVESVEANGPACTSSSPASRRSTSVVWTLLTGSSPPSRLDSGAGEETERSVSRTVREAGPSSLPALPSGNARKSTASSLRSTPAPWPKAKLIGSRRRGSPSALTWPSPDSRRAWTVGFSCCEVALNPQRDTTAARIKRIMSMFRTALIGCT